MSSLFVKLARAADPTNTERHTWKTEDTASAVVSHLRQMLHTRQGSSLTCPEYGVPDTTHYAHDIAEGAAALQRGIKLSIQLYEPRLKNVQVRLLKNEIPGQPGMLFEVSGHILLSDGRRQPLRIGSSVDEKGRIELTEL